MNFAKSTICNKHTIVFSLLSCFSMLQIVQAQESLDTYLDLGLEDLLSMEVTSVSRKKQRLTESAAAIFVITRDDIRRSGVTSIAEALRMAPGIQVGKMDSNKWAVSSRGINGQFSNKLLVLIDGRSVYTPAFSGVYWEVQDTMLQDIDRIEVIRGPGATIWGANAVNGVINVITRSATETQGGLVVARVGDEEKSQLSMRYGFITDDETSGRVYFKAADHDSSYATELETDARDEWNSFQSGFRLDLSLSSKDQLTLQGDVYKIEENQRYRSLWLDPTIPGNDDPYEAINVAESFDSSGYNLLTRWQHNATESLSSELQIYLDHTEREEQILGQQHDTVDIDFTQRFSGWNRHDVIWGLGYRHSEQQFNNSFNVSILPDSQSSTLINSFIQDEIELIPETLRLTLGIKLEDNEYTGLETQPSVRLLWLASNKQTLWASFSKAVRTPSLSESAGEIVTLILPPHPLAPVGTPATVITVNGNDEFDSEKLKAFEIGYRVQPSERLSIDIAFFKNKYTNLNTFEASGFFSVTNPADPGGPPLLFPSGAIFDNKRDANSQGMEMSADWYVRESWRLQFNYSYLDIEVEDDADSTDYFSASLVEGSAPRHQWSLRSLHTLSDAMTLDLWLYRNGGLDNTSFSAPISIPAYNSLNARFAWQVKHNIEFSVVGQNLLDDHHAEFAGENFVTRTEVERSMYAQLRVEF